MKHINKLLIAVLALAIITGCTTQRKKGDLSTMGKLWHNTTSHYNGYFNANEIIYESTLQLADQHEDNYLQVLDMYEYIKADNPQSVAEQLDEAVRKVTVVVNLHPYSQWSDDCYLLAGKALFLKQDYEGAEKAFRYLMNEYPPEFFAEAKQKSTRGNGKSSGGRSAQSNQETEAQPKTARERERERKAYNREVQRRKKQRARGKNNSSSSSRNNNSDASETTTETPSTETETTTDAASSTPTRVRLSDATDAVMAENSDGSFLKHKPAYQEGMLWLAKTLVERDDYGGARRLLTQLIQNPGTYKEVQQEAVAVRAYLAITERDYATAVTFLDSAIDLASDKDRKARYAFIMAQLHQKNGSSESAYAAFAQVLKLRPAYAMEFAARLNIAQNAYLAGKGTAEEAIANLEKLLKDDKNADFQDQVYYAMAEIALAQGNRDEGITLLEKSLAHSSSNAAQKAEAYYRLGSLFYDDEKYLPAKLYYDSTLMLMTKVDERFTPTERLRDNLVDIAMHLETITLQDSILVIAEMTAEEQAALAKQVKEEEQIQASVQSSRPNKSGGIATAGLRPNTASRSGATAGALRNESSFWAYDNNSLRRGQREYKRRWGTRPLTDDWRRSSVLTLSDASETVEAEVVNLNLLTPEQISEILASQFGDIPDDENGKEASRLAIKQAMFQLGRLYRDRLENNEKTVAVLEKLNVLYPGNIHELDSWYYLYVAYNDLKNQPKAQEYRDKILDKYPTSNYGRVLVDPNYAQEYLDKEHQLNRAYDEVYGLFSGGSFQQARTSAQANVSTILGRHPLKPKYALLTAMCVGNTDGKEAYIAELQKVIATYPETPEETRANEILRLLGGAGASLPGNTSEENGVFKVGENDLHYIVVVFSSADIDLNANKITVSDYNRTYHSLDKIRISNVYLGESNDVPVLVLRRFKDQETAMAYYEGIEKNIADFISPGDIPYEVYPITQSNYREILRNRSLVGYKTFFESAY